MTRKMARRPQVGRRRKPKRKKNIIFWHDALRRNAIAHCTGNECVCACCILRSYSANECVFKFCAYDSAIVWVFIQPNVVVSGFFIQPSFFATSFFDINSIKYKTPGKKAVKIKSHKICCEAFAFAEWRAKEERWRKKKRSKNKRIRLCTRCPCACAVWLKREIFGQRNGTFSFGCQWNSYGWNAHQTIAATRKKNEFWVNRVVDSDCWWCSSAFSLAVISALLMVVNPIRALHFFFSSPFGVLCAVRLALSPSPSSFTIHMLRIVYLSYSLYLSLPSLSLVSGESQRYRFYSSSPICYYYSPFRFDIVLRCRCGDVTSMVYPFLMPFDLRAVNRKVRNKALHSGRIGR